MTRTRIVAQLSAQPRYRGDKNLEVLTKFTIKDTYSWSGLGYVAEGDAAIRKDGDREPTPGPWAYGYPLGHCMAANPEMSTGAEQRRLREQGLLIEVNGGEEVEIAGVVYIVSLIRRGRDAWVQLNTEAELRQMLAQKEAQQADRPHPITAARIAELQALLNGEA